MSPQPVESDASQTLTAGDGKNESFCMATNAPAYEENDHSSPEKLNGKSRDIRTISLFAVAGCVSLPNPPPL